MPIDLSGLPIKTPPKPVAQSPIDLSGLPVQTPASKPKATAPPKLDLSSLPDAKPGPSVFDKSFGERAYDAMFNAPEYITRKAKELSDYITTPKLADQGKRVPNPLLPWLTMPKPAAKGFLGGTVEGAASQASPANLVMATSGMTAGKPLANLGNKVIGGLQIYHGMQKAADPNESPISAFADVSFGAMPFLHGARPNVELGGKPPIPEGPLTKEQALAVELKGAQKLRDVQEGGYSVERSKRFKQFIDKWKGLGGGEGASDIAMGKLGGELPKVKFEPIRQKFATDENEHINDFYKQVLEHPKLSSGDKITGKKALDKILNADGVGVPQTSEIDILGKVFGPDVAEAMASKLGIGHYVMDTLSVPRSTMASMDLSAPGRQAIGTISRGAFWKNLPNLVKSIPEKGYNTIIDNIEKHPDFEDAVRAGINFADVSSSGNHNEFFPSELARKYYPGVKASERAFTGYLDPLRMDLFADMKTKLAKTGIDLSDRANSKVLSQVGDLVNISTGRGNLPNSLEQPGALKLVNSLFFAPRLAASRVQMFTKPFSPNMNPIVRKEYIRNALGYVGYMTTMLGLANVAGAEVNLNPTNPDFLKGKFGNTRLDFSAGVLPIVRLIAQVALNESTSSNTGKTTQLGEGYKADTALDKTVSFLQQKAAPGPSLGMDLLRRKDVVGNPISPMGEAGKYLTPLILQDINDIVKDDPNALPLAIPGFFGAGVQTYSGSKFASQKKNPYTVKIGGRH